MRLYSCFLMLTVLSLVGCGSTPYRDDYAQYTNQLSNGTISESGFQFSFEDATFVDMRGVYLPDDSIDSTQIMYQGAGGLVGLLAQIGTHSAIIQSQRTEKLVQEQEKANQKILSLIEVTKDIPLTTLIGEYDALLLQGDPQSAQTIRMKPIFFSNAEMNRLSLKSVVWLPNEGQNDVRYKNLIQIYGPTLDELQRNRILNGDREELAQILSSLLKGMIYIAKNELTGKYTSTEAKQQTFLIENDAGVKAIRGTVVEEKCGYQIIKDIRSWYMAYPKPATTMQNFKTQC
ncbi:hypothetical protein [Photobacterium galatheae]|uniref:Lipoprotein n=1 Tax=Photobacterium galatheae TaxID=1654360 RepID=A0A066RT78_9GAMM|nr:hypothetical protein [Photobacterium galatheae]KDM92301.1 hypothetical protein EA58_07360 [Photobacterium galatheae]MCM0150518.1 hypothetical protein [Photobacterium galatheae]